MNTFKQNPNRTVMYGVIADYWIMEIIKSIKGKGISFPKNWIPHHY
jgi:hypothetical protein